VPLRRRLGFTFLAAWFVRETEELVWILGFGGGWLGSDGRIRRSFARFASALVRISGACAGGRDGARIEIGHPTGEKVQ